MWLHFVKAVLTLLYIKNALNRSSPKSCTESDCNVKFRLVLVITSSVRCCPESDKSTMEKYRKAHTVTSSPRNTELGNQRSSDHGFILFLWRQCTLVISCYMDTSEDLMACKHEAAVWSNVQQATYVPLNRYKSSVLSSNPGVQ